MNLAGQREPDHFPSRLTVCDGRADDTTGVRR